MCLKMEYQNELEKAKFEYEHTNGWTTKLLGLIITCALGYAVIPNTEFILKIAIGIAGVGFTIAFFGYWFSENKKFQSVMKIYNRILKNKNGTKKRN